MLSNTGSDTLNITELTVPAAVYTQALSDSVLEPGAAAELNVVFSPDLDGYYTGDLVITSDTYLTGSSSVALSGLKLVQQSFDFSGVLLGESSAQGLTYENNGTTDLVIGAINSSFGDYTTDPTADLTLPAGSSGLVTVTFAPSERGPVSGELTFTTDASSEDLTGAVLSGEGWLLPTADFAATSVSVVTSLGNDVLFDLELTNNGDYPLDYTTSVDADYAGWVWLETLESGQVVGTTQSDISVGVINTANLDPGTFTGIISFSTNTGSDPTVLEPNTHTVDVFLNLLGDDSQLTDTTVTIPSGNIDPITFTDASGNPIGLMLDFVNSAGGTVSVQSVSTLPPVDAETPVSDPDGLITDPVYPAQYYEIDSDIEGSFVTDIGLSYNILPGISSPNSLRIAKRPGNSGTAEPWQVIALSDTEIDTLTSQVVAVAQTSFSQWALLSNSSDNSFTDTQGPSLSSLGISPAEPGALVDAIVNVSLSDDSGIESATLYYAQGGGSGYTSVAMSGSGGSYSGTIPGNAVTQNGLLYYVTADDVLGYTSVSDTLGASVNFASGTLTTNSATGSAYSTGLPMDAWRMISIPAVLDETGLSNVLDELGTQDNSVWRVFRYDDVSSTYKENPVDLNTAESYWIYQKQEDNLLLSTPSGKTGDMSGTTLTLATGWNFIGSPYPFPLSIDLDPVQFYGPLTYGLSGESWSPEVTELDPWNGYVVYNRTSSSQTVTLDPSVTSAGLAARVDDQEEGWLISLMASAGEYTDPINTFGALETADNGLDWHDNPEITSPGKTLSLFFEMEDDPVALQYTSDIRQRDNGLKVWDVYLSNTTGAEVSLSWSHEQPIPSGIVVQLLDINTRRVIDLKSAEILELGSIDSRFYRQLKIVSGDETEVAARVTELLSYIPEELSLDGNYPNPFNPVTTIRFGLPQPRDVRITVVNILGQEVTELISGWRDMGRHEVVWQGKDRTGKPVASGMYFTVLSDGDKMIVKKMLLLK